MLHAEFSVNQVVVCVCAHINLCVFSLVGRAFVVDFFCCLTGAVHCKQVWLIIKHLYKK